MPSCIPFHVHVPADNGCRRYKGIVEPFREVFGGINTNHFRYASEYAVTVAPATPVADRWQLGDKGYMTSSVALPRSRAGASSPSLYRPADEAFYKDPNPPSPGDADYPNRPGVPGSWRQATRVWTDRSIDQINKAPNSDPVHPWLVEPRENQKYGDADYIVDYSDLSYQVQQMLKASGTHLVYPKDWCEFSVYWGGSLFPDGRRFSTEIFPAVEDCSDAAALIWVRSMVSAAQGRSGIRPRPNVRHSLSFR